MLNDRISKEEIIDAIKETKSGKVPGPDGITAKFYKTLKDEIVNMLEFLMKDVLKTKRIPDSWKEANISLILKEGQDSTLFKNYRPISLLNNDYKIFAKIMAERLKKFLNERIMEEQAGFLSGRHIRDNLRTDNCLGFHGW